MDGAGKDSAIKHVLSGVSPQSTTVHAFKAPSEEERDHDYLWRVNRVLPERGKIGIFNRSHYEEVLTVRGCGPVGRGEAAAGARDAVHLG
jgi:polyphosphate kinase 2 (PPK2 family)